MKTSVFKNCRVLENGEEVIKDLFVDGSKISMPISDPDDEVDAAIEVHLRGNDRLSTD